MDPESGEITIELVGKEYKLIPTVGAAMSISNRFDGFTPAMQQIVNYNVDAMAFVIHHGMGRTKGSAKDLYSRVYKTGVNRVALSLVKYIEMLSNGGRPMDKNMDTDDFDEGDDEGN